MDITTTPEYAARLAARLADAPEPMEYVRPHPELKGQDRVWEDCGFCLGTGVYHGPSGLKWKRHGVEHKWCFRCEGAGGRKVLVSSIRGRIRGHVNAHNRMVQDWITSAPQVVLEAMEAEAAEQAKAQAAADAHAAAVAKLEDLPQEGAVLQDIPCTVAFWTSFTTDSFSGYGTDLKALLKLQDADGNLYVWITTSSKAWEYQDKGAEVTIRKARVKRTSVYRDEPQVELNRPTLVSGH